MSIHSVRKDIVEMVNRGGWCAVDDESYRIAFPSVDQFTSLALAVDGHRPASTPEQQVDAFCAANNFVHFICPATGRIVFAKSEQAETRPRARPQPIFRKVARYDPVKKIRSEDCARITVSA